MGGNNNGNEEDDEKTVFDPAPPSPPPPPSEEEDERTIFIPRSEPGAGEDEAPPASDPLDTPAYEPPAAPPPAPPPNPSAFPGAAPTPPNPSAFPNAPTSPSEPIRPIEVGDYVNVFRIERFIARGGMGEVWEAVNPHPPHERVAVKIMLPDLARDENVLNMFYKEASALGRLHHESIVQYRIASQGPNGQPYLITEFVDGPSLEAQLGDFKPDEEQFKRLAQRLTRGLGAAHAQGVVHRDIAPDNILLVAGDPDRPKIIDFGIVKDTNESNKTIIGDGTAGKLRYMAPEQMGEYNRNVGPWTDVYSLALTMLAVATGDHADMGGSMADAVLKRRHVPDISAIPERLQDAFTAALQPNPADRPQSMADFSRLLDGLEAGELGGLDTPLAPLSTPHGGGNKQGQSGKKGKSAIGAGLLADPQKKWLVYGSGGVIAALALLVIIIVIATRSDDIPEEMAGGTVEPATQPAETRPASIEDVAASAIATVDCAWLNFEGSSGNTVRFTGGAARPGAVQTALEAAFAANGMPNVTPDTRGLITFGENLCPMLDALGSARSERPLMSTPQESYEIEKQEIAGVAGQIVDVAKPILQTSGLNPSDEILLLYIDGNEAGVFASGRATLEKAIEANMGSITSTGFQTVVPYFDAGSTALVIVTGKPDFPTRLFPQITETDVGIIRVTPEWARQFEQEAQAKDWRTDMVFIRITDEVPN